MNVLCFHNLTYVQLRQGDEERKNTEIGCYSFRINITNEMKVNIAELPGLQQWFERERKKGIQVETPKFVLL